MNEPSVSIAKIVVAALWTLVASLMLSSWVALALEAPGLSSALGLTACATSAAAATAHVRRYASRICHLMRYLNSPGDGLSPVRSMRD